MALPFRNLAYYGTKGKLLGEGTYGQVWLYDGKYAIKKMQFVDKRHLDASAVIEVSNLVLLRGHPNILEIEDVIIDDTSISAVLPFMKYGTLDKWFETDCTVGNHKDEYLIYSILSGVGYMHQNDILHLDLKPANILIDERGDVKIADFGRSEALSCARKREKYNLTTINYRAPEIFFGGKFSAASDVWSIGAIAYKIYTDQAFAHVYTYTDSSILLAYAARLGTPSTEEWPELKSYPKYNKLLFETWSGKIDYEWSKLYTVIARMLKWNPASRDTVFTLLSDPYFDTVRNKEREPHLRGCIENLELREVHINHGEEWSEKEIIDARLTTYVHEDIQIFFNAVELGNILNVSCKDKEGWAACLALGILKTSEDSSSESLSRVVQYLKQLDFRLIFSTVRDFLVTYKQFYSETVLNIVVSFAVILTFSVNTYTTKEKALFSLMLACLYTGETFHHADPSIIGRRGEVIEHIKRVSNLVKDDRLALDFKMSEAIPKLENAKLYV